MASSRKNKAASPRAKAGIGAARAASQARSLPEEAVNPAVAVDLESAGLEPVASESIASEPAASETAASKPVTAAELVEASEIFAVTEISAPIVTPKEILEAVVVVEPEFDASVVPIAEAIELVPEVPAPPEISSTPRNKSKVSNPKTVHRPKGDKTMTQETEKSAPLATKKETAIAKTGSALPLRPVTPSELTVVGMISSAGERPIGAATIAVFGTYLNGRPIEASSLKLFEILPGDRPVFSTDISYVPGTPFGGRPVMVSPAGLLGAEEVMGNRPIFSNDMDPDSSSLMGYLD
jgi:hypothetical protein